MVQTYLYFLLVWLLRVPFVVLFLYTLPFPKETGISNLPIALCSLIFVVIGPYEFYKIFHSKFADVTSISVMGIVVALDKEKKEIHKLLASKVSKEEGDLLRKRLSKIEEDLNLYEKLSEVGVVHIIPERETLLGRTTNIKSDSLLARALEQRLAELKIREP